MADPPERRRPTPPACAPRNVTAMARTDHLSGSYRSSTNSTASATAATAQIKRCPRIRCSSELDCLADDPSNGDRANPQDEVDRQSVTEDEPNACLHDAGLPAPPEPRRRDRTNPN